MFHGIFHKICKKIRIRFQKNILPHCVILVSTLMERFIRRKYLSFCGSKDRRGKAKTRQQGSQLTLDRKRKETVSRKKRQTKVYRCHSADSYYEQSIQIVYSINNVPICTLFLLGFSIKIGLIFNHRLCNRSCMLYYLLKGMTYK